MYKVRQDPVPPTLVKLLPFPTNHYQGPPATDESLSYYHHHHHLPLLFTWPPSCPTSPPPSLALTTLRAHHPREETTTAAHQPHHHPLRACLARPTPTDAFSCQARRLAGLPRRLVASWTSGSGIGPPPLAVDAAAPQPHWPFSATTFIICLSEVLNCTMQLGRSLGKV